MKKVITATATATALALVLSTSVMASPSPSDMNQVFGNQKIISNVSHLSVNEMQNTKGSFIAEGVKWGLKQMLKNPIQLAPGTLNWIERNGYDYPSNSNCARCST